MFRITGIQLEDIPALTNRKILLPGEREPLSLRYAMEYHEMERARKAERRRLRKSQGKGLVARLRLVLSRE